VLLLRYFDDLPPREIASRLGIPPGTARSRLSLALAELRARVDERERAGGGARRALVVLAGGGGVSRWAPPPVRKLAPVAAAGAVAAAALIAAGAGTAVPQRAAHARVDAAPRIAAATARDPAPPPGGAGGSAAPRPVAWAAATPARDDTATRAARAARAERYKVPLGAGPVRGPADAKVTIVEFVDYQCPFTSRAAPELARVLERYRGQVRFQVVHRPMEFHPQAALLARGALAAAEQGRFWELHDRLLARARELWTPALLDEQARAAGLDVERFRRDRDGAAVRARAEQDEASATSVKIDGTPMFFVNGRPLRGAHAPSQMGAVIDEELARAELVLMSGVPPEGVYNATTSDGRDQITDAAAAGWPRPGRKVSYEALFTRAGACGPPVAAPTALDFAPTGKDAEGRRTSPWSFSAAHMERYRSVVNAREGSTTLSSTTAEPEDFVADLQTVIAEAYRGKRVRFSAEVKGEEIATWAGLFIRAEGADEAIVASARTPIVAPGQPGWHPAEVTLTIPPDAKVFSFGMVLAGRGTAAMRRLAVDVVP
jgi:protein-disulfide isomerase